MFLYIILILFLIFILPGLIRGITAIHRFRRQTREAFNAMYGRPQQQERKAGWSGNNRQKKKKIDKDVGEYVSFEDITVEQTSETRTDASGSTFHETEQQITDAEWEDIR